MYQFEEGAAIMLNTTLLRSFGLATEAIWFASIAAPQGPCLRVRLGCGNYFLAAVALPVTLSDGGCLYDLLIRRLQHIF